MIQINLLPWREQARKAKLIRFLITLGFFVVISLFLVVLQHIYYDALINHQQERNTFLESEIAQRQTDLNLLKVKKKNQTTLQSQLHFITDLRKKSFMAVKLLDELASAIPPTVSLEKIERVNNDITLSGKADSDLQITLFMKNLGNEQGFNQPVLSQITTKTENAEEIRYFQLKIQQQD